jgi:hypothetical protein
MRVSLRVAASFFRVVLSAGALLVALGLFTAESRAASWLEKNFGLSGPRYDGEMPLCHDSQVMWKIQDRFSQKEREFWQSALQIGAWEDIRELALRPWHYAAIPRRFCRASVLINDGTRRPIYYSIAEDSGILGVSWGVEWCVVGLDRNWAYNPACKMAKP